MPLSCYKRIHEERFKGRYNYNTCNKLITNLKIDNSIATQIRNSYKLLRNVGKRLNQTVNAPLFSFLLAQIQIKNLSF